MIRTIWIFTLILPVDKLALHGFQRFVLANTEAKFEKQNNRRKFPLVSASFLWCIVASFSHRIAYYVFLSVIHYDSLQNNRMKAI